MAEDYKMVVTLSFFAVLSSAGVGIYVKNRVVPGAGGLDGKTRKLLRALAALGLVLNVAASILVLTTSTRILTAKLGLLQCLPAEVRAGIYAAYVLVGAVMSIVYFSNCKTILFAQE